MHKFRSIDPQSMSKRERHHLMLSAVAPRPICFASTIDAEGNVNLSPFSFFNVFSSTPPVLIFSPARNARDNSMKDTHSNVLEVNEVVISIVNYAMVEQMSLSSTAYDKGVNEFLKAGFTEMPSEVVRPPRVGEAPVSFECIVREVITLGDNPEAGNLVICDVKRIHVNEMYFNDDNRLDVRKLDLVGRMGGHWYNRAAGDALFEVKKPFGRIGIGFDQLPERIVKSNVLTANEVARLAGLERLPTDAEMIYFRQQNTENTDLNEKEIEEKASLWIKEGKVEDALKLLMS